MLSAPALEATTYVMVSDAALADQAQAVVEVQVVQVEPATSTETPATDYLVDVEEVVQGYLPGSRVVVRVPGGVGTDGVGLRVFGAPEFALGERALLFLVPGEDGSYSILHLMLGAFHERQIAGRRVAQRDLAGAHEVVVGPEGRPSFREHGRDRPRDLDRFADWLADRAAGVRRERDYLLEESATGEPQAAAEGLEVAVEGFSLMTSTKGNPIRWFKFDRGETVAWRVHTAGQAGLGLDGSIAAFKTALEAWNGDAWSGVRYAYAGTTSADGGLSRADGTNTLLFDDPQRAVGSGPYSCASGGILGVGGPFYSTSTRSFNGKSYHEALQADIVINDGTECFFRENPRGAEMVFAHELGHTLGLGHSPDREALMYAAAQRGRDARLAVDDQQAIASLYPSGSTPPPPPPPPPAPVAPAAPSGLAAQVAGTEVRLTWRDNSDNELDFRLEQSIAGRPFRELLKLPGGTTEVKLTGLRPAIGYRFRLRARSSAALSPYSNMVSIKTGTGVSR